MQPAHIPATICRRYSAGIPLPRTIADGGVSAPIPEMKFCSNTPA